MVARELLVLKEKLLGAAFASTTHTKYEAVWSNYVSLLHSVNVGQSEWSNPDSVVLYLAALHSRGVRSTTMSAYSSALSHGFKVRRLQDPTSDYVVRKLVSGAQRLDAGLGDYRHLITYLVLCRLLQVLPGSVQSAYELRRFIYIRSIHGMPFKFNSCFCQGILG